MNTKSAVEEEEQNISGLAGRELNVAILERVMDRPRPEPITRPLEFDHLPIRRNGWTWIDERNEWVPYHNYSSDIAAAMQVVEKLIADGQGRLRVIMEATHKPKAWEVDIKKLDGDGWYFVARVEAETLPLAICRAALEAVQSK